MKTPLTILFLVTGCASGPSPELRAARSEYAVTTTSAVVDPGPLIAAREALDHAEHSHDRNLAYVAQRKAEIARAAARILTEEQAIKAAQRQLSHIDRDPLRAGQREPRSTTEALVYTAGVLERARLTEQDELRSEGQLVDHLGRVGRTRAEPGGFAVSIAAPKLFEGDGTELPADTSELDAVAFAIVRTAKNDRVIVECRADSPNGGDVHDQRIAQKRADAIADYLASKGVPKDHIEAVGLAPRHVDPAAASYVFHGLERKVEITVKP